MKAYILSQFQNRVMRTCSVILGIAIGTGLFLTLNAFGNGYKEAARLPLQGVSSDLIVSKPIPANEASAPPKSTGIRMPFGLKTFSSEEVATMKQTEGVQGISAVLQVLDFNATGNKTVVGISADALEVGPGHALQVGIQQGRSFRPGEHNVAVVDRHYAAFFKVKVGSTIQIADQPFQVTGIVNQSNTNQASAANLYIPLEDAQKLAGLGVDQYNQVYIRVADAGNVEAVTKHLQEKVGTMNAISEDSLVQVMGGIGQVSARFSNVAAAIGLIGGGLLAWFALSGMINERQKEIAIMRAVGWSRKHVVRVFLTEALVLSVVGGLVGVLLGWLGAWALQHMPMPDFGNLLSQNSGMPGMEQMPGMETSDSTLSQSNLPVQMTPLPILVAMTMVVIGGLLAGWYGVRKMIRIKPAQVLRQR